MGKIYQLYDSNKNKSYPNIIAKEGIVQLASGVNVVANYLCLLDRTIDSFIFLQCRLEKK